MARLQEMRELGDSYARSEFKAHKKAQIGQVRYSGACF